MGGVGGCVTPPSLSALQLGDELKQHLSRTLSESYGQPGTMEITASIDRLQQDVSPSRGLRGLADMGSVPTLSLLSVWPCGPGQVAYLLPPSQGVSMKYVSLCRSPTTVKVLS